MSFLWDFGIFVTFVMGRNPTLCHVVFCHKVVVLWLLLLVLSFPCFGSRVLVCFGAVTWLKHMVEIRNTHDDFVLKFVIHTTIYFTCIS